MSRIIRGFSSKYRSIARYAVQGARSARTGSYQTRKSTRHARKPKGSGQRDGQVRECGSAGVRRATGQVARFQDRWSHAETRRRRELSSDETSEHVGSCAEAMERDGGNDTGAGGQFPPAPVFISPTGLLQHRDHLAVEDADGGAVEPGELEVG